MSSAKARNLCRSLEKPSEANAKVLASLFPACASSRTKRPAKFDPLDDCVAAEAHRRKKKPLHQEGEKLRK